jgi:hypothetical protein
MIGFDVEDFLSNIPDCPECHNQTVMTVRINKDGSTAVLSSCDYCVTGEIRFNDGRPNIKQEVVWYAQHKGIPWALEVRIDNKTGKGIVCEYGIETLNACKATDVQYHHFALKSVNADAELWPKAWLCTDHHTLWHDKQTPGLLKRPDTFYKWDWESNRIIRFELGIEITPQELENPYSIARRNLRDHMVVKHDSIKLEIESEAEEKCAEAAQFIDAEWDQLDDILCQELE